MTLKDALKIILLCMVVITFLSVILYLSIELFFLFFLGSEFQLNKIAVFIKSGLWGGGMLGIGIILSRLFKVKGF
ncbi:hypothetical protein [Leminorella grimontii]|uniref:hypothetical protein n=1 Tax=Leminorella grimontii TaxID=82981 RepID=UPI0020899AED|nr:hypothetical protein [Leminorella grimontii]GKX60082.1 hypothetical protein SOASR031_23970 [Leminorella grimontii]